MKVIKPKEQRILKKDLINNYHVKIQFLIFCLDPDDIVIDLIRERLSKPDCKINGWVLDGCPTTPE
jgi:hypothetical protein